ncbi:MAG: DUF3109 family protein [Akkermansiaceae bacterium]|jgi:hypothetical protein
MSEFTTIFRETAVGLARQLGEAAVDHAAFERGLSVCDLASCRATCCHDGAILSDEEADVLRGLDDREGIEALANGQKKTRTIRVGGDELAEDFPDHFPKTRCVYLDEQHRCYWQLRSVEEGRHPWFYKPTSCWMHPVLLTQRDRRPFLTILSPEDDVAGFASNTPCGMAATCSKPARLSMAAELKMLESISGRNFSGELNAPSAS